MTDTNVNIRVCAVAALTKNDRVIGKNGDIPWKKIPKDMKRFVHVTKGKPVIMGRITLESIIKELGGPLPKRTTVVITSDTDYLETLQGKFGIEPAAVRVAHSPSEGLEVAKELAREGGCKKVCVAGGGSIYKALLPKTDELVLTLIDKDIATDGGDGLIHFPPYEDEFSKKEIEAVHEEGELSFTFATFTRP